MKKTFKKTIPILLAIMVMVLAIPVAFAADEILTFGPNVTGVLNTETGVLTISGTGDMPDYLSVSSPAYAYRDNIQKIIIEDGVTGIGNYTFNACSYLTSLLISPSVTKIGNSTFYNCSNLSSITCLYEGAQTMGKSAFAGAGSAVATEKIAQIYSSNTTFATAISNAGFITEYFSANEKYMILGADVSGLLNTTTGVLTISGTGPMIDFMMPTDTPVYKYKDSVKSIYIENGVTSIGACSFYECANLINVNIPTSVTRIGEHSFERCSSLQSVVIPKGVTIIEGASFWDCHSLSCVTISSDVTTIGNSAFYNCMNLKKVVNLYNGMQTVGTSVFANAGSAIIDKAAYCSPANTTFIAEASAAGYTIIDSTASTGEGMVEATVPMNGMISATTISITHPLSVEYAIDPNLGYDGGAFVAPDIAITNNSIVPVKVTVKSLSSAVGGSVQFTDVAPGARDWAHLGVAESKSCIALGVKIANSAGWKAGHKADTRYAVETGDTLFGTLSTGATGHMSMVANYGLSINQNCTAAHNLVFMFDLA